MGNTKVFFTIEIRFEYEQQTRLDRIKNVTPDKLKEFRENVFTAGFAHHIEADHYTIVAPTSIRSIDVWKQKSFFKNYQYGDNTNQS